MFTHPVLLSIEILPIIGSQALDPLSFASFVNLFFHLPLLVCSRPLSFFILFLFQFLYFISTCFTHIYNWPFLSILEVLAYLVLITVLVICTF